MTVLPMALVLLASLLSALPAHAALDLTLDAAVASARQKNVAVIAAREKVTEAQQSVPITRAAALPSLNAALSAAYRKDPLNIGNPAFGGEPYNFYDLNLKLQQGIYAGGAVGAAVGSAKRESQIRELDLAIAERDTIAQTMRSFYGVLLQQRRVETLERNLEFQKWLLATAQERYRKGSSRNLEVLQAKTQVALLEPQLFKAKAEMQVRAAELAQLIGEPGATQIRVTGSLEPHPWSEVQKAVDADPGVGGVFELLKARTLEDQAEDKRSVGLSKHYPRLDAVGVFGKSSYVQSDLLGESASYWNVGLQLSIPIFSGLSSLYERRQFAAVDAQLQVDELKIRDQFTLDQLKSKKKVELSETLFEANRTALANATAAMKEARDTYRYGTTTYQQLFETSKSLTEAEFAFEQAKYDYVDAQISRFIASGWKLDVLVRLLKG